MFLTAAPLDFRLFIFIPAQAMITVNSSIMQTAKIAGYFPAIYYIMGTSCSRSQFFVLMAVSYFLFLITSAENVPMITMDYLLVI